MISANLSFFTHERFALELFSSLNATDANTPPEAKCVEMTTCFTPSNITGKILAAGLGILDTAVVNWKSTSTKGNTEIPMLEAGFISEEKVTVTRKDLEKNDVSFSFDLNPLNSIVINKELSMLNTFNTQYDLMSNTIL